MIGSTCESPVIYFLNLTLGFLLGKCLFQLLLLYKDSNRHTQSLRRRSFFRLLTDVFFYDLIAFIALSFVTFAVCPTYNLNESSGCLFLLLCSTLVCFGLKLLLFMDYRIWPDISVLKEAHKYAVGYGAAVAYYYNYLDHILPTFTERMNEFEMKHQMHVVKTLIILIPKSCHVQECISEDGIERARELMPFTLDIAGVKDRHYNVTIYQVDKSDSESILCAVEYAQPTQDFFDMRKNGEITECEMHRQCTIFVQTMKDLLSDEKKVYLHEFDNKKESKYAAVLNAYNIINKQI